MIDVVAGAYGASAVGAPAALLRHQSCDVGNRDVGDERGDLHGASSMVFGCYTWAPVGKYFLPVFLSPLARCLIALLALLRVFLKNAALSLSHLFTVAVKVAFTGGAILIRVRSSVAPNLQTTLFPLVSLSARRAPLVPSGGAWFPAAGAGSGDRIGHAARPFMARCEGVGRSVAQPAAPAYYTP